MKISSLENKSIADRLKQAREKFTLGQNEFASKCGVGYSTYQKYEMGLSKPGSDAIEGFVRLGLNANWLLTGKGEMMLNAANETKQLSYAKNVGDGRVDTSMQILCLSACKKVYGDGFGKLNVEVQLNYANDLCINLETISLALGSKVEEMQKLEVDGVAKLLENLIKLDKVQKFPPIERLKIKPTDDSENFYNF